MINICNSPQLTVSAVTLCTASGLIASLNALPDLPVGKGVLTESKATDTAAEPKGEQNAQAMKFHDDFFAKFIADFTDKRG